MCRNGHLETPTSRYPTGRHECRKCVVARVLRHRKNAAEARMETAPDYASAALAKSLMECLREIEAIEAPARAKPVTPLDEFTVRLADKRRAAGI